MKKAIAAMALCSTAYAPAFGGVIYSENFNDIARFKWEVANPNTSTDYWSSAAFNTAHEAHGVHYLTSNLYYVTSNSVANEGAMLLGRHNTGIGGSLYTDVAGFTVGQRYTLTFNLFGTADRATNNEYDLKVTMGSDILANLINHTISSPTTRYTAADLPLEEFDFTATSAIMRLMFTDVSPTTSRAAPIIDNITIANYVAPVVPTPPTTPTTPTSPTSTTPVPEPGSAALLLAGLSVMDVVRRRRA